MGKKAEIIKVSTRVLELLKKEVRRNTLEKRFYERMGIIIKASEGLQNKVVASHFNCEPRKVTYWRNRWQSIVENNTVFETDEQGEALSNKQLLVRVMDVFSDSPRSGHPRKFTDKQVVRLQALACEKPEDYGLPFTSWTHVELSNQAKKMGIDISPSRVGIILKKRFTTS